MLKTVIFDLDNTLYDYDFCDRQATETLMTYLQFEMNIMKSQGLEYLDMAKSIVKSRLGNVAASHNRMLYMQTICELAGKKPMGHAIDMYDAYWDSFLKNMELFPYVEKLFAILKNQKKKIAILTDLTAQIQHRKIRQLNIERDIDYFVSSEEAGEEKPSSQIFKVIMEKTGCQKDEVIMIGDSLEKDIKGAQKYGINGLWFAKEKADYHMNGDMLIDFFLEKSDEEREEI